MLGDQVSLALCTDRLRSRAGPTLGQPELGYSRQKKTYPGSIHGAVWECCICRRARENRTWRHIWSTSPRTAHGVTTSDQIITHGAALGFKNICGVGKRRSAFIPTSLSGWCDESPISCFGRKICVIWILFVYLFILFYFFFPRLESIWAGSLRVSCGIISWRTLHACGRHQPEEAHTRRGRACSCSIESHGNPSTEWAGQCLGFNYIGVFILIGIIQACEIGVLTRLRGVKVERMSAKWLSWATLEMLFVGKHIVWPRSLTKHVAGGYL